jgi:hypothetical protein
VVNESPRPLAEVILSLREGVKSVRVNMWTEGLPKNNLQLWHVRMLIHTPTDDRVLSFEMPDVPLPGNYSHLTARLLAMYPDVDTRTTYASEEDEIRSILTRTLQGSTEPE